ncbi:ABC transporter permease [Rhodococcus sp. SGAir0479]|uniref:ABC transporter permease n=1 Tax=Rhodococcus sp. SGAir0479 TaxID=2567884 RepID=UPI0010CD3611|nr:ABC transporter permease [Rhodococcus sp. SGAir0479]QCQ94030.1 ABC transporter permease [Rhodococcus sp. SGAir0479]
MAVRRVAFAVPLIVVVSAALFALASRSPFDPLAGYLGDRYTTTSDADRARLAAELGLHDPWWTTYGHWVGGLLSGDLGTSRSLGQPVATVIAERLPWTLLLTCVGLGIAIVVSFASGVWSGARPGSVPDRVVAPLAAVVQATPPFVLSLGAVAVFALSLGWLPVAGLTDAGADPTLGQVAEHLVLPVTVLAVSQVPWLAMSVRRSVRDAIGSDAVRGARARGIPERTILLRHVVPVALGPFATVIGLRLPEIIVGAAIVEEVFSWPGIAGAVVTSARELDFPLLAALTVGTTLIVLLGSLLADVALTLLDPRVSSDG